MSGGSVGKILVAVAINTFVFPVIVVLLMKQLKFVESLELKSQKERFLPYIAAMVFYFWGFLAIHKLPLPSFINWVMLGAAISITLAFISNIFSKTSIHTVGMGCLLAVVLSNALQSLFNTLPLVFIAIFIAGLVGAARMYLQSHEPREVYAGYMIGLLGMMMAGWFA